MWLCVLPQHYAPATLQLFIGWNDSAVNEGC